MPRTIRLRDHVSDEAFALMPDDVQRLVESAEARVEVRQLRNGGLEICATGNFAWRRIGQLAGEKLQPDPSV